MQGQAVSEILQVQSVLRHRDTALAVIETIPQRAP